MKNIFLKKDKSNLIYVVIIFLILMFFSYLVRPTLNNIAIENYEQWRQSDTYVVAKIYDNEGIDLLRPKFYYDGIGPHVVQLELELLPMFGVLFKRLFGANLLLSIRIVSLTFFLISAVYMYLLSRLFLDNKTSIITLLLYLTMPLNIALSRAIMPEALIMCFYLGSTYYLYRWYKFDRRIDSYLSAIFLSIAIIEKVPLAFFGLAVIYLYFKKYGLKVLKNIDFYLYGVIALLPTIVYMIYMQKTADHGFVSDIAIKHIFSREILSVLSKETLKFHLGVFKEFFTLPIFTIFGISIIKVRNINKEQLPIIPWLLALTLEVLIICGIIKFSYYYIFYTPIVALMSGIVLGEIFNERQKFIVMIILLICLFFTSRSVNNKYLSIDEERVRVIEKIKDISSGKAICMNTRYPMFINELDRYGARLDIGIYDEVPKDAKGEIEYWISDGIEEFLLFKGQDNFEKYEQVLKDMDEFTVSFEDEEMVIYDKSN